MLFYTNEIADQHRFQTYFPVKADGLSLADNTYGIDRNDLTFWSGGGFNSAPNGDTVSNRFLSIQQTNLPGPDRVEWPLGKYPLEPASNPTNNPLLITDLLEYLSSVLAIPYTARNCDLIQATCQLDDLDDADPEDVAHPSGTP